MDAVRNLNLLYRRVQEATPAMRLFNDLLNMQDGFDDGGWLKEFKNRMVDTFPGENLFSILVPAGNEINKLETCDI
ncbi:protein PALE CRESS, chloroplastic-like [Castanea sativa]|uniref:protein PALE CRESS, chloroplastic-like n=1 Tax=Castanea sativa TaxID=21020 RepID=UPI003F6515E2